MMDLTTGPFVGNGLCPLVVGPGGCSGDDAPPMDDDDAKKAYIGDNSDHNYVIML